MTLAATANPATLPRTQDLACSWAWAWQFRHVLGRFGYPFHVVLACFWCLTCTGPIVAVETFGLLVAGCWVLRVPFVWRTLPVVFLQPLAVLILAMLAWGALSLWWSPNPAAGLRDLGFTRWLWAVWVLWPVIDRRGAMVACLAVGLMGGHVAQLVEFVALHLPDPVALFKHPPAPNPAARVSGWWYQPALGGVLCVVSLGMHLGPALVGVGWRRYAGLACALIAGLGIIATGSRGAMLSGLALTLIVGGVALCRSTSRAAVVMSLSCCLALIAGAAWVLPGVNQRLAAGWREVSTAVTKSDFESDTGVRMYAAKSSLLMVRSNPIGGVGLGGFDPALRELQAQAGDTGISAEKLPRLKTAHSTYFHALAVTGLVGLGLLLAVVWRAVRDARALALRSAGGTWAGTYASGPCFALVGLALCGLFETIQLNTPLACIASVLLALSPSAMPRTLPRRHTHRPW